MQDRSPLFLLFALLTSIASAGCDSPSATEDGGRGQGDGGRSRGDGGGGRWDAGVEPDGGPVIVCGNLTCDGSERCDTCEIDCGECEEPVVTECNDGVDNDGDGLVDWQLDLGCWSERDNTERAGTRAEENGFSTFDPGDDTVIIYVSASEGDDANDGRSPETAVATPRRGAQLVRDASNDFLLFRRGDTWRGLDIGEGRVERRFKSGRDAEHPLVVASYGDSTERPRLEIDEHFIDDDGNARSYLAVMGLALVSYRKVPGDAEFNGEDGGAFRFVGASHHVLLEDNYIEYGEITIQNSMDMEVRRNVVYRSYQVGTCAYNADGSRNPNGNSDIRPSGIFAGSNDGLLIEGNVWDENGWNPDLPEACATIYNHDMYLSGNDRLVVRDNLVLRSSSIGLKLAANSSGASDGIVVENNLFAEGEIGISMGGNDDSQYRFLNATIRDNVLTDIGRTQPTTRTLTWYIDLTDNDGSEVVGNLLVNQPALGNEYGINLGGGSQRGVDIHDNFIHGLARRAIWVRAQGGWDSVAIHDNEVVGTSDAACLVSAEGGFSAVTFAGNAYRSSAGADSWFCLDGDRLSLADWRSSAGESDASESDVSVPEPGRNLDSYASTLGVGSTLADFAAAARRLSRHRWRPELTAPNAANYIRAGFGLEPR